MDTVAVCVAGTRCAIKQSDSMYKKGISQKQIYHYKL